MFRRYAPRNVGEEYFEIREGIGAEIKKHKYARLLIPKWVKSRFTSDKSYISPCKVVFTITGYEGLNYKGKIDIVYRMFCKF